MAATNYSVNHSTSTLTMALSWFIGRSIDLNHFALPHGLCIINHDKGQVTRPWSNYLYDAALTTVYYCTCMSLDLCCHLYYSC